MDEDENSFFPTLTAGDTIDFATRLNVPYGTTKGFSSAEEARKETADFLFRMLNIAHTKGTKVGNEYIRGVSGGERKRIGITEVMAASASICLWDNSTRGLDASTALLFVQSLRKLTDLFNLTTVVTLYQAGNGIYDLFDKVLVLDKGEQIYFGPRESARSFFEELGFICADGANVADYLTGMVAEVASDQETSSVLILKQASRCPPNDEFVQNAEANFLRQAWRSESCTRSLRSRIRCAANSIFRTQQQPKNSLWAL